MHKKKPHIVVDVETTGMEIANDEILQLALLDDSGATLFYQTFSPRKKEQWRKAQKIHGISPSHTKDHLPFEHYRSEIQQIIDESCRLIAYNADFDIAFLRNQGINLNSIQIFCLMKEFSKMYGQKKRGYPGYVWKSLEFCARFCGYPDYSAHDALADAKATLFCYQRLFS